MKYSYNWLRELSGTKLSSEKVAENLTMHSFELEGVEKIGGKFENIIVGKILEIRKHPNADKLQLTKIDIGSKKLDIVCGAKNIEVGQKVPVALIGAKLPNGLVIREAEIRGEKSFGMLCAMDELGLGTDHSGIIILDKNAKIGELVAKYLGADDSVLEIKVLPDRAHDAMSHVGVAREISVLENRKFDYDFEGLKLPKNKVGTSRDLSVRIEDKKLCSRYIGVVMDNIEIKDSPMWMQNRLKASGINAINNVVDATNYVMLELGQPMHAFDAEKLATKNKLQIIVRRAKKNEELELLDETKLKLSENDLLITNGETPLALAGIMGGKDSGINDNTKTIVIESANFNAVNIRRSRTRLGVKTESSDRYEKDIDPNLAEKAMVRIIEILEKTANGKLEGIIDVYPNVIKSWKIKFNLEYANSLLGEKVPKSEMLKILNLLGIKTVGKSNIIAVEIPTFRIDLRTQEDLIEEIGRIWGYEKIKIQPILDMDFSPIVNKQLAFERKIKKALLGFGYDEMYNYSFYSRMDADNCGLDGIKHFELANPMNPDQQFVRVSLIPNMLKNIKTNLKIFEAFKIFEIGKVYSCHPELGSGSRFRIPCLPAGRKSGMTEIKEERMLVMAQVLEKDKNAETFYELKGAVEDILENFGIKAENILFNEFKLSENRLGHPERMAEIEINGEKVGFIGEINPIVLRKYKIEKRVAVAEFDTEKLLKVTSKEKIFTPLQKFPTSIRDISMLAKKETKAIDIQNLIKKIGGSLVMNVKMFDVFQKENQTSFAYHIEFGKEERTLESKEVDKLMEKITSGLEKTLKVEVRK
ncbi:MAG TPA: phenylalanine--tRNA ligase subunit beta [Candidatus Moranbacteria bacterium]|nr:phenylalanine--tRNA ligase subunit beta [Candidatus Moranbacteria bacterium]